MCLLTITRPRAASIWAGARVCGHTLALRELIDHALSSVCRCHSVGGMVQMVQCFCYCNIFSSQAAWLNGVARRRHPATPARAAIGGVRSWPSCGSQPHEGPHAGLLNGSAGCLSAAFRRCGGAWALSRRSPVVGSSTGAPGHTVLRRLRDKWHGAMFMFLMYHRHLGRNAPVPLDMLLRQGLPTKLRRDITGHNLQKT